MAWRGTIIAMNIRAWGGACAVALVLLASSAFLLYRLGQEPLQDYDEATYAEVVHEALVNHQYLSFTDGGGTYFKKPPALFWAMAASESLFGETPFAMRLPFVISGIAVIAAVMLLVFETSGSWWAAAYAGAVLATTAPFMETARQVRLDAPVVLCIMLAVYCFMRGLKDARWFIFFGAVVGLGVMVKSVIALFALPPALFLLLLYRRFDLFCNTYIYGGVAAFLLVAAPWHLYEWAHFGNAFFAQYIGVEVLSRAEMNLFWTVSLTNADYARYMIEFVEPWVWIFFASVAVIVLLYKKVSNGSRTMVLVSTLSIAVMGVVFFTAKTKAPTYLMPMYPFMAVAIALAIYSILPRLHRLYQVGVIVLAILLLISGAEITYYDAYHFNPYYSVEIDMAKDEYQIGRQLLAVPQSTSVYVYDDENLGSIVYYSQHLSLLSLTATSSPVSGTYVVVDTDGLSLLRFLLQKNFPTFTAELLYSGPQVSLVRLN